MSSIAKRSFDLAASLVLLVLLAPLLLLLTLAVSATSRGGPFFRQVRVGRYGRHFRIVKFRSMHADRATGVDDFEPGATRRITAIGTVLRATKLDELPQLWNVLRGDMSLVGPRPEVPRWTEVHPRRWEIVLSVRPGITDPASLAFRHEERLLADADDPEAAYRNIVLPRKLELSERYVRERSFRGDLGILLRTAAAVFAPPPPCRLRGGDLR